MCCLFIRSVSQIFLLPNSNRKRYFHSALKPIKRCSIFTYGSPLLSSMWYQVIRRYVHGYRDSDYSVLLHPRLQHPLKNWQDRRCKKLTASTFGQAIGLFPKRRVQLWLEKLELDVTFRPNLAICWGNIKEEEALKRYEFLTGHCVPEPPKFVVYDEENHKNNWLAASPDRLLDWKNGGVLEIKCPCVKQGNDRSSEVAPWKRIPLYYMPQAQGLMEKITNREWMDFYVWTLNGSSLFRVHRDKKYWGKIKVALSDFWMNHVVPAREICEELKRTKSIDLNNLDPRLCKLQTEERHKSCVDIVRESKLLVDRCSELLFRELNENVNLQNCIRVEHVA